MTASVTIKRQNLVPIAVSAAIGLSVAFVAPALPPVVEVVVLGAPMLQSAAVLRGGSISAGAVTLSAPARTSSAVVRAAVVVPGVVDLVAPKIASGAVLRGGAAENLNASEIVLIAPFLLSAPTLRSAAVAPQEVSLVAPALGSGAVLRSAGVAPGEVALVAPSLPSAAVLRVGAIAPLSVTLAPPFLLSSSILRGGAIENITGGYEAEAQAYFDGMTVKPSSTDMTAYNAFILDGKANGWWSILDRLYIHGAHHEQAARVNMKRPANVGGFVNGPLFTAKRGVTGDGATSHFDAGEAIVAAGGVTNYTLNSAHILACCIVQSGTSGGTSGHAGANQSTRSVLGVSNTGPSSSSRFNDSGSGALTGENSGSRTGRRIVTRTGANAKGFYFNGSEISTGTGVSSGSPTGNFFCLRNTTSYSDDTMWASGSGGGLTAAQIASYDAALVTLRNALGIS